MAREKVDDYTRTLIKKIGPKIDAIVSLGTALAARQNTIKTNLLEKSLTAISGGRYDKKSAVLKTDDRKILLLLWEEIEETIKIIEEQWPVYGPKGNEKENSALWNLSSLVDYVRTYFKTYICTSYSVKPVDLQRLGTRLKMIQRAITPLFKGETYQSADAD